MTMDSPVPPGPPQQLYSPFFYVIALVLLHLSCDRTDCMGVVWEAFNVIPHYTKRSCDGRCDSVADLPSHFLILSNHASLSLLRLPSSDPRSLFTNPSVRITWPYQVIFLLLSIASKCLWRPMASLQDYSIPDLVHSYVELNLSNFGAE